MAMCVFKLVISHDRVTRRKEGDGEKKCLSPPVPVPYQWGKSFGNAQADIPFYLIGQNWSKAHPRPITGKGEGDSDGSWFISRAGEIILSASVLSSLSPSLTHSFSFHVLALFSPIENELFLFNDGGGKRSWWEGGLATGSSGTTESSMASRNSRLTTPRKWVFSKHLHIQCQRKFWLAEVRAYLFEYHCGQSWPYLSLGMGDIALSVLLSYNYCFH